MSSRDGGAGRARADALVASFGRAVGAHDARLDASGDVSFGEAGFHYDADRDALVGRVFVERAWAPDDAPAVKDNFRKVAAALEDPKVGGMYEKGGGRFVLDEGKRAFFLTKDFPIATTTEAGLRREMEVLLDLGAVWATRWLARVAAVAHGWEPPPARRVTRADEPER